MGNMESGWMIWWSGGKINSKRFRVMGVAEVWVVLGRIKGCGAVDQERGGGRREK